MGSGLTGKLSQVSRPMIIGRFRVSFLKFLRSSETDHGSWFFFPIPPFSSCAHIKLIFKLPLQILWVDVDYNSIVENLQTVYPRRAFFEFQAVVMFLEIFVIVL